MLPDMDGFKVIEYIDKEETAVIFLTALQDVMDKVKGLKLGAEDYIVKPFETVELLARTEVVLRRKHKSNNTIHYGDITMNIDEHTVKKGDDYVSLTPKEFDILAFFLQNQDIALTRERLLATVWGYEFMGKPVRLIYTYNKYEKRWDYTINWLQYRSLVIVWRGITK